jgi:hypothetical protein
VAEARDWKSSVTRGFHAKYAARKGFSRFHQNVPEFATMAEQQTACSMQRVAPLSTES